MAARFLTARHLAISRAAHLVGDALDNFVPAEVVFTPFKRPGPDGKPDGNLDGTTDDGGGGGPKRPLASGLAVDSVSVRRELVAASQDYFAAETARIDACLKAFFDYTLRVFNKVSWPRSPLGWHAPVFVWKCESWCNTVLAYPSTRSVPHDALLLGGVRALPI